MAAIPFFITFMVMVSITFMNMFIAIILEGFDDYHEEESHRISQETITEFTKTWQEFDPLATGYIKIDQMTLLLQNLIHKELKMTKDHSQTGTFLFNLSRDKKLVYFTQFQQEVEDPHLKDLKNNVMMMKALARYMD